MSSLLYNYLDHRSLIIASSYGLRRLNVGEEVDLLGEMSFSDNRKLLKNLDEIFLLEGGGGGRRRRGVRRLLILQHFSLICILIL